jgi:hypothetical protein
LVVVFLLLLIGRVDKYIVKVTPGEVFKIRPLIFVNVSLKRRRCICQPEWHNLVFELTIAGLECSLELVAIIDSDEVVRVPEVQFSNDPGFVHSIEYF